MSTIDPSQMFAESAFAPGESHVLIPFLTELDAEEADFQKEDEMQIQAQEDTERILLSFSLGPIAGVTSGGILLGVLKDIVEVSLSLAGPIAIVAGIVMTIAVTILGQNTNGFSGARSCAEWRLGIQNNRAIRLQEKLKKVTLEKNRTIPQVKQIAKVEKAFLQTVKSFDESHPGVLDKAAIQAAESTE